MKGNGPLGPLIRDFPIQDALLLVCCWHSSSWDWASVDTTNNVPEVHGLKESLHFVGSKLVVGAIKLQDIFIKSS